jgi:hypothetical protein
VGPALLLGGGQALYLMGEVAFRGALDIQSARYRTAAAVGLDPVWWTFLRSRAETRENVHDDSASETLLYARVQAHTVELVRTSGKSADDPTTQTRADPT